MVSRLAARHPGIAIAIVALFILFAVDWELGCDIVT